VSTDTGTEQQPLKRGAGDSRWGKAPSISLSGTWRPTRAKSVISELTPGGKSDCKSLEQEENHEKGRRWSWARNQMGNISFSNHGVAVLVGRRAAAQQSQRFVANIPKFMFATGRNGNGVAGFNVARFAFDANPSRAVRNVINFLGFDVIMFLRARAGRQTRLRQALVADDGIAMRQQFADFRTVLGDEGRNIAEIFNVHGFSFILVLVLEFSSGFENEDDDENDFNPNSEIGMVAHAARMPVWAARPNLRLTFFVRFGREKVWGTRFSASRRKPHTSGVRSPCGCAALDFDFGVRVESTGILQRPNLKTNVRFAARSGKIISHNHESAFQNI
jgi:hypothetical protein